VVAPSSSVDTKLNVGAPVQTLLTSSEKLESHM